LIESHPRISEAAGERQFDTQSYLHWLLMAYISEQSNLLPRAYFHVVLEQVAGEDEMLDLTCHPLNGRNIATSKKNSST